ncbi:MAG: hypothetical protein CV089_01570 [Nitrospira sp. WS110]|nr:hypothetical protein [Nitrospira sp. WS110]
MSRRDSKLTNGLAPFETPPQVNIIRKFGSSCTRILHLCMALVFSFVLPNCGGDDSPPLPPANTIPVRHISFSGSTIDYDSFMPAIHDYYKADGHIEPLGLQNDGRGNLTTVSMATLGLSPLFDGGRVNRDCRLADFNGDGFPDIVCNTYSPAEAYRTNPTSSMGTICTDAAGSYSAGSVAMLFFNNKDDTFTEDQTFTGKAIRGYGETILVADFNNDGFLDIFLPYYSHCSANEHSYLLMNDGNGIFTDIADTARVGLRNVPLNFRVEGAQALDFDNDGWIDFYVGGHFFMNNHCIGESCLPTFSDQRAALGLPLLFDEGVKFLDWNNDGLIDIVVHHPATGPDLYQFNGRVFERSHGIPLLPSGTYENSYGMNIYDLNNDGKEDIVLAGGSSIEEIVRHGRRSSNKNNAVILLNDGTGFQRADVTLADSSGNDIIAFGDTNRDGRIDVMTRIVKTGTLAYFRNDTAAPADSFLSIDVVGPNGEKNQQGRVVKVTPQNHKDIVFTRIVDSGSGYMAQNQYDLLVGTGYSEAHVVRVFYSTGTVQFIMNPGERKRVYPNSTVVDF